jgi:spore coat polysaccharide biosynthesis protein SpsF (cytidylyltransferase family)
MYSLLRSTGDCPILDPDLKKSELLEGLLSLNTIYFTQKPSLR